MCAEESEQHLRDITGFLQVRAVTAILQHDLLIFAAVSLVFIKNGSHLSDLGLGWGNFRARPTRHRAQLAQEGQVEK